MQRFGDVVICECIANRSLGEGWNDFMNAGRDKRIQKSMNLR